MDVPKRLKELRLSKNLTTTELALKCNMQQSTISKLENNKRIVDIPTLIIICEVLEVSLADFFYYENLPIHVHNLLATCKQLSPKQLELITLTISSLLSK